MILIYQVVAKQQTHKVKYSKFNFKSLTYGVVAQSLDRARGSWQKRTAVYNNITTYNYYMIFAKMNLELRYELVL